MSYRKHHISTNQNATSKTRRTDQFNGSITRHKTIRQVSKQSRRTLRNSRLFNRFRLLNRLRLRFRFKLRLFNRFWFRLRLRFRLFNRFWFRFRLRFRLLNRLRFRLRFRLFYRFRFRLRLFNRFFNRFRLRLRLFDRFFNRFRLFNWRFHLTTRNHYPRAICFIERITESLFLMTHQTTICIKEISLSTIFSKTCY